MGGQWRLVKPEGLAPAPRGAHASVALGTRVVVFGGADRAPITLNDLWVLETAGGRYDWTRISPVMATKCKLLPRSGATLTLVGDRIYLFGGTEPVSGVCFNDLKVLDPATWTWSNVEAQGTLPPARHSHCTGCLEDTCLIVYGGAGYQGPMQDVWIYNTLQNSWSRPTISGPQPAAREMHTGCMVDSHTILVYGGRGSEFKVCCDAALFNARLMKWTAIEPTPFSRCAHSSVVLPAPAAPSDAAESAAGAASALEPGTAEDPCTNGQGDQIADHGKGGTQAPGPSSGTSPTSSCRPVAMAPSTAAAGSGAEGASSGGGPRVLVYGGYSGEAVEGDVLQIDGRTLEIELVRRGPRESDKDGTVPAVRFAHSAVVVPATEAGRGEYEVVVFGGVNPREDLNDVATWIDA